ncbi:MAG: zinc ribbon domain-containing protein [Nitrospira sp. CG24A]|nr:MAG: zinc ribbon domain-containing protein [Nitrospira sp. CG24A]
MKICPSCRRELPEISRYCSQCGQRLHADHVDTSPPPPPPPPKTSGPGQLNIEILYIMVGLLSLALLFPPWETPPSQAPEFLGLHFILNPPTPEAIVSRLLLTIELVTIAIAGLYSSFLFRQKP